MISKRKKLNPSDDKVLLSLTLWVSLSYSDLAINQYNEYVTSSENF